jgi:hypothetical protein
MMVLTNRADQAALLWQAAVAVLAEVAQWPMLKPVRDNQPITASASFCAATPAVSQRSRDAPGLIAGEQGPRLRLPAHGEEVLA